MDKELRLILEEVLDLFEADQDDLLNWGIFTRRCETSWGLDEWLEVQDFAADAIRAALDKEET